MYYGSNLVSWQSKKQATVARSSIEDEYKSLADATLEALWVAKVPRELGVSASMPYTIWCDSASAIRLIANLILHVATKHVAMSYHFVREKVADGSLLVRHILTKEQQANVFTKALPYESSRYHCGKLMHDVPISLRGGGVLNQLSVMRGI